MANEAKSPRKRWSTRKRVAMGFLFAFLALIVGLGLLRWIWGVRAERALRREIAAIRATGEPLAWSELAVEPVADDENAALLYLKAGAIPLFDGSGPGAGYDAAYLARLESMVDTDAFESRRFRSEHHKEFRDFVALAAEPLALCREARGMTKADWGLDFSVPPYQLRFPKLSSAQHLSRLLHLAALAAREDGRDADALEYVRDTLAISRAAERMPVLLAALLSISTDSAACSALEDMTARLKIGESPAATKEQVGNLIRELLDEQATREAFATAIVGERAFVFDNFERVCRGEVSLGQLSGTGQDVPGGIFVIKVCQPMLKLDEVRVLRHMTQMAQAVREESSPATLAKWPVVSPPQGALDKFNRVVSLALAPSMSKVIILYYRNIAIRRMAAVAMAVRMHEIDHGKRPAKLDDLVGQYLPAVPADPFDPAGGALRYLPDADPPVLYSVNQDGKDDGGEWLSREEATGFGAGGGVIMIALDLVCFLNGDRPQEEPTSYEPAATQLGELPPPFLDFSPRGPFGPGPSGPPPEDGPFDYQPSMPGAGVPQPPPTSQP